MSPLLRRCLAGLALLIAGIPWVHHTRLDARRQELLRLGRPLATQPATVRALSSLASEPNPSSGAARLARALVAEALVPKSDSRESRELDLSRLALARSLAQQALGRDAGNWEALLALGAATYLEASLAQDNSLFTEVKAWERPLRTASELAPGRTEPARFLSLAYLELWQILPPWKKEQAIELLRAGLEDPATFDRLIEPWLQVSASRREALALVPDQPLAWQRLRTLFEARRDWPALAEVEEHFHQTLESDLARRLDEAERAAASGERDLARVEVFHLLERMPVDGRYATSFARAMTILPPGPLDSSLAPLLSSWFLWSLERLELGKIPLPANVLGRLSLAAAPSDPAQAALAALAAGQTVEAERLERQAARLSAPGWASYWLARARFEATQGEPRRATGYLRAAGSMAAEPGGAALYHQVQAELAARLGDTETLAEARAALARLSQISWPSSGWSFRGPVARRELLLATSATGLAIEILALPSSGTAIDIRWDGTTLATLPVPAPDQAATAPNSLWLELRQPLPAGLSRLEIEPRGGQSLVPGAIRLLGVTAP